MYVVHQINHEIPVIRPLIGFDKLDVIKLSQKLEFYELSLLDGVACQYNPKFPETRAKISQIEEAEKNLDRNALREQILAQFQLYLITPE